MVVCKSSFSVIPILLVLPLFQQYFFKLTGRAYLGPFNYVNYFCYNAVIKFCLLLPFVIQMNDYFVKDFMKSVFNPFDKRQKK